MKKSYCWLLLAAGVLLSEKYARFLEQRQKQQAR